ncbi:MAG TPA: RsmB/NOP family class I SAM-dependent RNA methyltransferase [Piscinibacter sp.]|jgi:16S rRNA (cytosine967-C5)-methyltransferase|uniref:RsmB/NOP family class I SAM-dependent RNA methyltransferase n=1 Tax=Piscinibacter sp. TaxID=1903157 RepID=UPI001D506119|nr:RsmB/NOP family class I SAM-dependent RNA methyltransferase [Piscinibacter sp.]MBK7531477.1 RsmB/NOP family class I SAM-dependent RNA methyltransferase [Piscinibacter sp.]HOY35347.1 RsmB/NOP family class I SAM-dependent RNA methyltransferase [Piscinibacter sp.]HPG77486.1 RsmB/NOP family class I SAM-dependent RNA methyltransferase [Piscinibacter sp.]HPM67165.1 RsmB/NOP family class I SAM-dependent RNA methyltransferase [Piscinibacter sp.]
MHPNALLELATELLHRVLQFKQPADNIVSDFFREHRALGSRERHTLAETTYTVLRQRLLFQHLAQSGKGEMERRLAILAWQGNEGFLRAALSEPEQHWIAQVQAVDRSALPEKLRHNLPEWLAERLHAELGEDFWPFVESMNAAAPLDLRVNTFKAKRDEVRAALAAAGVAAEPTPFSPMGLRIQGKPALHKLDVFTRGDVEVQDEGSQLLALMVDAKRGEMVVDFCAGAGGKTLALGAAMRNTGRLYAFDTSGHRLAALKPRLARSGLSNVYPVQIAHERDDRIKRLAGKIDRVLVDAPCSGLGTLRRNPDMKWRQTPDAVEELRVKQAAILASAARLLKPGGRLVYATCSLLGVENEAIADAFTEANRATFRPLAADEVLAAAHVEGAQALVRHGFLRLWPHRHGTDGFFAAVWQRS